MDAKSADDDDRRALLGMYSSVQLQTVGLCISFGAAAVGELVGLVALGVTAPLVYRALIFGVFLPTAFLTALFLFSYRVSANSVKVTLRHSIPTYVELERFVQEHQSILNPPGTEANDIRKIDPANKLNNLDIYYSIQVRLLYSGSGFYQKIRRRVYLQRFEVIGIMILLFILGMASVLAWGLATFV